MTITVESGAMDLDTHFWQPLPMWEPYIEPSARSAVVEYHLAKDPLAAQDGIDPEVEKRVRERMDNPAVEDPHERLAWMDLEGLYLNVVYPYPAWFSFAADADLAVAGCRAMNDWAGDFAAVDPARLKPAMMLPVRFPELAVREFRRANEELGLDAVFAVPTPTRERRWSHADYDPLWAAIEAAGAVMLFHEFTRLDDDLPGAVRECYRDNYPLSYLCGHTVEAQLAVTDMIGGGALERFPALRVGFVEAHVAWLPGWLALMDDVWPRISSRYGSTDATGTLPLRPSEYFRRQCTVVAFPDDIWVPQMIDVAGAEAVTLCSDFPHPNATGRTPIDEVFTAANPGLARPDCDLIVNGNARRLFGLG